jgi:hypothetical protein
VPPPYIPKTGPIPVAKLKPVSEVQLESWFDQSSS